MIFLERVEAPILCYDELVQNSGLGTDSLPVRPALLVEEDASVGLGTTESGKEYEARSAGALTEGSKMTEKARQPKDKNYNLISALSQAADNVETFKSYIRDAEEEGDQEVVSLFEEILENNLRASQRLKEMLVPRLQSEQE